MKSIHTLVVRLGLLAICLICNGCVALGGIDRETGTIDKGVGDARNASILLNILRASQDEPLYFYSINQVGGSGLEDFKISLPPVTFGPRQSVAQQNYTLGTNGLNVLDSQVSGNFNVAILDSKNFYAGMLAPLDLLEVNLLLKQGFPRELVYRLVVQDVTVYWAPNPKNPDGELDRFVNDPNAKPEMKAKFNMFLSAAMDHGITIEEYQVPAELDKPSNEMPGEAAVRPASAPKTFGRLCSDLALVPTSPDYAGKVADASSLPNGPFRDVMLSGNACGARPAVQAAALNGDQGISNLQQTFKDCEGVGSEGQSQALLLAQGKSQAAGSEGANRVCARLNGQVVAVQLDTRSVYGIFRYLGEALANDDDIQLNGWGSPVEQLAKGPLMTVVKGRVHDCFAAVDLHTHYCLPIENSTSLKQTFSIINALQALKTSAGDLPYTPTVRIEQ